MLAIGVWRHVAERSFMVQFFLMAVKAKSVIYIGHLHHSHVPSVPNGRTASQSRWQRSDDISAGELGFVVMAFMETFRDDDVRLISELDLFDFDLTGFHRVDASFGLPFVGSGKMWS
jgi:hypothetical protein